MNEETASEENPFSYIEIKTQSCVIEFLMYVVHTSYIVHRHQISGPILSVESLTGNRFTRYLNEIGGL